MVATTATDAQSSQTVGSVPMQDKEAVVLKESVEDEAGITSNHIGMVMEHTSCTRNEAIRALRESKDDMIDAVMKISGN